MSELLLVIPEAHKVFLSGQLSQGFNTSYKICISKSMKVQYEFQRTLTLLIRKCNWSGLHHYFRWSISSGLEVTNGQSSFHISDFVYLDWPAHGSMRINISCESTQSQMSESDTSVCFNGSHLGKLRTLFHELTKHGKLQDWPIIDIISYFQLPV